MSQQRIAVIGSGVAGLAAAWRLAGGAASGGLAAAGAPSVTLFEAGSHFGGHAHTVELCLDGVSHGVDTGFLVFNPRTYPLLTGLLQELGVDVAASDMSFSVQAPRPGAAQVNGSGLEWSGSSLRTVFAQPRNLLRPRFLHMLAEVVRFNRLATRLARLRDDELAAQGAVADWLARHRFGDSFRDGYLLPMIACIWSSPTEQMLAFPVGTLIRFCDNHGLIQVTDRPQWMTVYGGSRRYVRRMVARLPDARLNTPVLGLQRLPQRVLVRTAAGTESFDAVVLACHTDQALALLGDGATDEERAVLGAIRYQRNLAVLHTDTAMLPRRRAAWAAWNYERAADAAREQDRVCLHYLINRLQPLPWQQPVIVSLNPVRDIAAEHVHRRIEYDHPVFDQAALRAQARVGALQGRQRSWFCGAWCGYGFHEDGLRAGFAAADGVLAALGTLAGQAAPADAALQRGAA